MLKSSWSIIFVIFSFTFLTAQCISGDCQNGTGQYIYPSGARYVGQFEDGEIHGIGVCYYTDGSKYQGEWVHRYPEGNGTKSLADGRKWTGKWMKGQPVDNEGQVVVDIFGKEDANAIPTDIQSGCISGDCADGEGVFAYADGSRYEGQFNNGMPHGLGTFYDVDGEKYVGTFRKGKRDGTGTLHDPDGNSMAGEWRDGEFFGTSLIEKGQYGCVSGDCANGRGTYIYKDGAAKYVGHFKNYLPHGQGVVYYANGERYSGNWAIGSFDGIGTLYLSDGSKVRGNWKEGTFMGPVKETTPIAENRPIEPQNTPPSNSQPTKTTASAATVRDMSKTRVWAVVVGVASYNHMPALRYTDDDAYRMYAHLKSPEGGALSDNQVAILVDEDATKEKIEKTMNRIFGKAGPNDLIMLYFSGHGQKGYFMPIDFDGYNNRLEHREINAIFERSPAKYKLCIADACHSGSLLAMRSANVGNVLESYYKNLALARGGTALLMSSKSDETSLESSGLRQGVFSHFLIRGLKGEADINTDGIVSVQELFNFIDVNVREYTQNRQTPLIMGDYDPTMLAGMVRN